MTLKRPNKKFLTGGNSLSGILISIDKSKEPKEIFVIGGFHYKFRYKPSKVKIQGLGRNISYRRDFVISGFFISIEKSKGPKKHSL